MQFKPQVPLRESSILDQYSARMGQLVERRLKEVALLAAKQRAEAAAERAQGLMEELAVANAELRAELDRRLEAQAKVEYLHTHDQLTALPNRILFTERLTREMLYARRRSARLALIYVDLDYFKDVNDSYGHDVGDAALIALAARFIEVIGDHGVLGRLGGDEFVILCLDIVDADDARRWVELLLAAFTEPLMAAGHLIFVKASMGVTLFPDDGAFADLLHRNAELAMYRAKHRSRGGYDFYDVTLNLEVHRRAQFEQGMHQALASGQFFLVYQPQVDLASGRVEAFEALLRWAHPERGLQMPSDFVPVAERSNLIDLIGAWTLREACTEAMRWTAAGLPEVGIAVNVAAGQLRHGGFVTLVADILRETGLPPSRLELEITETSLISDMAVAREILADLHALGVTLTMDDFGVGYSSLNYIRNLAIDRIKIDRSFTEDMLTNESAAAIVRTIAALAENLGMETTVEGIETEAQAEFMRGLRCALAQGHYFGKPVGAEAAEALLRGQMALEGGDCDVERV